MKKTSLFDALDALGHDLKSPLASIQSVVALLRLKGETDPKTVWMALDKIDEKTSFLNENIDALFELAVLQENKYELTQEYIVLEEVLSESVQKLGKRFAVKTSVPTSVMLGDMQRLKKSFKIIGEQLDRLATNATQIVVTVSNKAKKATIVYVYTGEPFDSRNDTDPFEISTFLQLVNKEVHLAFFVAVAAIRLHKGKVTFTTKAKNKCELKIVLPTTA